VVVFNFWPSGGKEPPMVMASEQGNKVAGRWLLVTKFGASLEKPGRELEGD
jgi:hypothetical protein